MRDWIGVFDSGMGGISVLHAARRLLPNENFLYYGDNGNAPYGSRTVEEIRRLAGTAIDQLLDRGVKAIVIACNTATSAYAEILRARLTLPIVGMEPALKPAQAARHGGEILVLATHATLTLPKFQRLMATYGDAAIPVVGDGWVELVESGMAGTPEADEAVRRLLEPYAGRPIDCIVLGCTHYPFLARSVRKLFPNAKLFDGRLGTAERLRDLLVRDGLLSNSGTPGAVEFMTSGGEDALRKMQMLMDSFDALEDV